MIRVHIERLVVDGIPMDRAGAAQFQAALTERLGELLRADPPAAGMIERVARAGAVVVGGPATSLGAEVAASLHAALGGKDPP